MAQFMRKVYYSLGLYFFFLFCALGVGCRGCLTVEGLFQSLVPQPRPSLGVIYRGLKLHHISICHDAYPLQSKDSGSQVCILLTMDRMANKVIYINMLVVFIFSMTVVLGVVWSDKALRLV